MRVDDVRLPEPIPIAASRLGLSCFVQASAVGGVTAEGLAVALGGPSLPSFSSPLPLPLVPKPVRSRPLPPSPNPTSPPDEPRRQLIDRVNPALPNSGSIDRFNERPEVESIQIEGAGLPGGVIGDKVELGGGAYYYACVSLQGENPLFVAVRANWAKVESSWSPRAYFLRREFQSRWEPLLARQRGLIAQARAFDSLWPGLRVEARGEDFRNGWLRLSSDFSDWNSAASDYKRRCEGQGAGPSCLGEYRRLVSSLPVLEKRQDELVAAWAKTAEDINGFYAQMQGYFSEVEKWQVDLLEFNADLQAAGGDHYFAASQSNEILDEAKVEAMRTRGEVCDILDKWLMEAISRGDTSRRMKIVQAQKYAGCRNRRKREEGR